MRRGDFLVLRGLEESETRQRQRQRDLAMWSQVTHDPQGCRVRVVGQGSAAL